MSEAGERKILRLASLLTDAFVQLFHSIVVVEAVASVLEKLSKMEYDSPSS